MIYIRINIQKYAAGGQEDNYCRLCFVKAFKLRCVFPYGENPDNDLFRNISELALVKLNSTREPDSCVCSRCVSIIEDFKKFRRQCKLYNSLLLEAQNQLAIVSSKRIATVSVPLTEPDTIMKLTEQTSLAQDVSNEDIDPFEDQKFSDVESDNGWSFENSKPSATRGKRSRRLPKRYRKASTTDSDASSEPTYESDDSFKPTRKPKGRLSQQSADIEPATTKKKRGRPSKVELFQFTKSNCSKSKTTKADISSNIKGCIEV